MQEEQRRFKDIKRSSTNKLTKAPGIDLNPFTLASPVKGPRVE